MELKWADLLYIDIPQELHDQLLLQKEACLYILEGKDRRIREFLTELRNKDEEYQKMLKRQAHDINVLIKKMRTQYVTMQQKCDEQLVEVEDAFAQERAELMKQYREEIEVGLGGFFYRNLVSWRQWSSCFFGAGEPVREAV